ncbi:MAG: chorismate synthase [Actinobacteria bacterium HGW-Actinobacteria-7]|jgi:chorismate synthase|nr:MAG: chorismate synthase [Actinobacteria bacterium HGW-Actinobacteria-7]
MRYTTAGESHGRALLAIVTAVPAGISVDIALLDADLARRQRGYGRGGRQAIESDRVTVLSGVRFGRTLGSPVALSVSNRDWENWTQVMAVSGDKPLDIRETQPRPGHADLAGIQKTGSDDARDILERASARETAARVAAGGVAKSLLAHFGVSISSYVEAIGSVAAAGLDPETVDTQAALSSDVSCPDEEAAALMRNAIDAARLAGDSLGGVFVVRASGLVPGLGSYAEAARRLDAELAAAVMSIPAIKGVEFGLGFEAAALPGSQVHDPIEYQADGGFRRLSNRAGGLEGGMSNGEMLVVRAAMKPIPTLMQPLATVDIDTHQRADASRERSDVCAVPAAAVVGEAEVALVLANAYAEKFGGDCVSDMVSAVDAYRDRVSS